MGTLLATRKGLAPVATFPGEVALHQLASSGSGTNAAPWDVTAALASAAPQAAGLTLLLAIGAYRTSAATRLGQLPAQELVGRGRAGFPKAPNASTKPDAGVRVFPDNGTTFLDWGIGGSEDEKRPGNCGMTSVGVCHADYSNPLNLVHHIGGCGDQWKFERNVYSNAYAIWHFDDARGGANWDTCKLLNENGLYCYYGLYVVGQLLNPFDEVVGICLSDMYCSAVVIRHTGAASGIGRGWVFDRPVWVRTIFLAGIYGVYIDANRTRITNGTLEDTGYQLPVPGNAGGYRANANGVWLGGEDPQISGGTYAGNKTGTAITIGPGSGGFLNHVNFGGSPGDDGQNGNANVLGKSTNFRDLAIEAGRLDFTVTQPIGFTFTDNGTRTRFNGWGFNHGNPNAAGDWRSVDPTTLTLGFHVLDLDSSGGDVYRFNPYATNGVRWLLAYQLGSQTAPAQPAAGAFQPARNAAQITLTSEGKVEESDGRIGLTTGWQLTPTTASNFSGSQGLYTTTAGSAINLQYRYDAGPHQLALAAPGAPELGAVKISIDNGAPQVVQQGRAQQDSSLYYITPTLSAGAHSISIIYNDGETRNVVFDNFYLVLPGASAGTGNDANAVNAGETVQYNQFTKIHYGQSSWKDAGTLYYDDDANFKSLTFTLASGAAGFEFYSVANPGTANLITVYVGSTAFATFSQRTDPGQDVGLRFDSATIGVIPGGSVITIQAEGNAGTMTLSYLKGK